MNEICSFCNEEIEFLSGKCPHCIDVIKYCDFCGEECDGILILKDVCIEKKDGSNVILCDECMNHYIMGEYDKIRVRTGNLGGESIMETKNTPADNYQVFRYWNQDGMYYKYRGESFSPSDTHPTKQTVQTESGDVLDKDETCSASSVELSQGEIYSHVDLSQDVDHTGRFHTSFPSSVFFDHVISEMRCEDGF